MKSTGAGAGLLPISTRGGGSTLLPFGRRSPPCFPSSQTQQLPPFPLLTIATASSRSLHSTSRRPCLHGGGGGGGGVGLVMDGAPLKVEVEERIEKVIYGCRFMTMLGVLGSLMGSIICFLKGCVYVMNSYTEYLTSGGKVILMLVEAIDVYLIGTVMLVFGMGLYELFISNLDIASMSSNGSNLLGLFRLPERPKWSEIQSVNELKTKLGHVIVMVLLVGMFEKSKKVAIGSSTDLLCFAASILMSSGGLYLLSKLHTSKQT